MKKRKQPNKHQSASSKEDLLTLKDSLNADILEQLKVKQKELKEQEQQQKEAEKKRKKEERRQREKNKSFEELLNDSSMDWTKFK
ncbi:YqkE family protein [Bacillus sp. FJAT-52991]|uniref:YqkE family protein n=1 Tax=Bacillus kandeliae TaxID=3129297 RepID=A0ABZ2N396_9BACI